MMKLGMGSSPTQKMLGSSFMCKTSLKWKENYLGSSFTYEDIASLGGYWTFCQSRHNWVSWYSHCHQVFTGLGAQTPIKPNSDPPFCSSSQQRHKSKKAEEAYQKSAWSVYFLNKTK